jgi:hypothetical protein
MSYDKDWMIQSSVSNVDWGRKDQNWEDQNRNDEIYDNSDWNQFFDENECATSKKWGEPQEQFKEFDFDKDLQDLMAIENKLFDLSNNNIN